MIKAQKWLHLGFKMMHFEEYLRIWQFCVFCDYSGDSKYSAKNFKNLDWHVEGKRAKSALNLQRTYRIDGKVHNLDPNFRSQKLSKPLRTESKYEIPKLRNILQLNKNQNDFKSDKP